MIFKLDLELLAQHASERPPLLTPILGPPEENKQVAKLKMVKSSLPGGHKQINRV